MEIVEVGTVVVVATRLMSRKEEHCKTKTKEDSSRK